MKRDRAANLHIPEQIKTKRAYRTGLELIETADWLREKLARQLENFDLTWMQFRVLCVLYHEGPQYQQELGRIFSTSKQSVGHVLKRLEEEGWIERWAGRLEKKSENSKAKQGRRVTGLRLTAEGEKKIADVFPKHTKIVKCYLRGLDGREMETLVRLCGKVREGDAVKFLKEFWMDDPSENLDWKE